MDDFYAEIKQMVIETLDIPDVDPAGIGDDDPLVGGELGIDSIDVLELVMTIEEKYGIKIDNKELGKQVFTTFKSLADHIAKNRRE